MRNFWYLSKDPKTIPSSVGKSLLIGTLCLIVFWHIGFVDINLMENYAVNLEAEKLAVYIKQLA